MAVVVVVIIVIAVALIASRSKTKTQRPRVERLRPPGSAGKSQRSDRVNFQAPRPVPTRPTWSPPVRHETGVLSAAGDAVWLAAGQSVTVGGFAIHGGLLYVGRGLTGAATSRPDPALIDPQLPINTRQPDYGGTGMGYWPSYSDISPASRAAYLHWLADGRRAPEAYIGYVFLYFYGLERRLLVDAQRSAAAQREHSALLAEVRRLLGIYGDNHSFRGYAEQLLAVTMPHGRTPRYSQPPPDQDQRSWQLPFELRLGLGQLVADGKPIPAEWALAWLRLHPETRLRTPATRCPAEFAEVFSRNYQRTYGDGMILKPNKTTLGGSYRPASGGFAGQSANLTSNVPDVATLTAPVTKLREIGEQACAELDAYSRYLGRHPDAAAGSAAALALLPAGIARPADAAAQALITWVQYRLSDAELTDVSGAELLSRWPGASGTRLARPEAVLLAQLLERDGLGLEPDARFGADTPSAQNRVVLFRRGAEPVSSPSDGYAAAAAVAALAAVVAAADGKTADAETQTTTAHLASAFELVEDEQRRLRAHLSHVLMHPPTPAALRKRAAMLSDAQRLDAGKLLIAVAVADGVVTPEEIDALTRLFTALGLDPATVYSDVHALAAGGDQLTQVRIAGMPASAYALPPQPVDFNAPRSSVTLDPALVAARLADSARAASYLAEIFADDESATSVPAPAGPGAASPDSVVAGLDPAHSALLRRLTARAEWVRAEFEAVTAEYGLLPDGALDTLNEAAIDASGEPVCEGGDPIEINTFAVEEMLR